MGTEYPEEVATEYPVEVATECPVEVATECPVEAATEVSNVGTESSFASFSASVILHRDILGDPRVPMKSIAGALAQNRPVAARDKVLATLLCARFPHHQGC